MSTHNIGFYEDLTKIIFELSSNIIKYAHYFFCSDFTVTEKIFPDIIKYPNYPFYCFYQPDRVPFNSFRTEACSFLPFHSVLSRRFRSIGR